MERSPSEMLFEVVDTLEGREEFLETFPGLAEQILECAGLVVSLEKKNEFLDASLRCAERREELGEPVISSLVHRVHPAEIAAGLAGAYSWLVTYADWPSCPLSFRARKKIRLFGEVVCAAFGHVIRRCRTLELPDPWPVLGPGEEKDGGDGEE